MLIGQSILLGRRTIDQENIPVVGKFQDTRHVVRVQLPDLIHHAMELEIREYRGGVPLEHVQQHDIHHGFDQDIRTLGAYVRKTFYEARIIPVLDHPEFKVEEVRQADQVAGISVHRLDQLT